MSRFHKLSVPLALALAALTLPAGGRLAAQVYVANANADSVLVFDPAIGGPQAPLRIIVGALTQLNGPSLHSYFPWLVLADGFETGTTDGWSLAAP